MTHQEREVNHREQRHDPDKQHDNQRPPDSYGRDPARNCLQGLDEVAENASRKRPAEDASAEEKQERCAQTGGHWP